MRRIPFLALGAAVVVAAIAACNSPEAIDTSGNFFTLTEQHNLPDTTVAVVGSVIPLSFLVTHNGAALAGVTASWTAKGGDSRLVNGTTTSDSTGLLTGTWVLSDSVLVDTLTIETGSGTRTFYARTIPGAPTTINRLVSDSLNLAVGAATTLAVQVIDARNNLVNGVTIGWTASAGTLSAASTSSNVTGRAEVNFTASTAGAYRVVATLPGEQTIVFAVVAR